MQTKIDSASGFYLKAIDEINQGKSINSINSKYLKIIGDLKEKVSLIFDSVTLDYTNHKISQVEYDSLRNCIFFDSVRIRSERLSALGAGI